MTESRDLIRTFHEFADTLRSLSADRLAADERATLRAILVELQWLVERPEP
jgi:hypothetical protein